MGMFRSLGGVLARPFTSTKTTIGEAGGRVRAQIAQLRALREFQRLQAAAQAAGAGARSLSEDELRVVPPLSVVHPGQRFRALYLQNGWSEAMLGRRLAQVRLRKRLSLLVSGLSFLAGIACIVVAPVWLMLLMAPCMLLSSALFAAMGVLHGVYQAQIEERSCLSGPQYLSRADLFRHLVS